MKFHIATFALLLLIAFIGWRFVGPFLNTHVEQDACAFGPVTNARYRELLAQAEKLAETKWPPLVGEPIDVADKLRDRIDDLSMGMTSPYERIAAMHAVMRASGGFLEGMLPPRSNDKEMYRPLEPTRADIAFRSNAFYAYYFHSNYFGPFDLIDPYSTVKIWWVFHVRDQTYVPKQMTKRLVLEGDMVALVDYPNFLERKLRIGGGGARFSSSLKAMPCPEVPDAQWVSNYEERQLEPAAGR